MNSSDYLSFNKSIYTIPQTNSFKSRRADVYSDRLIPSHGSLREQEITQFLFESHVAFSETPYRRELARACFDMKLDDLLRLRVHRFKRSPQIDHSLHGEIQRQTRVNHAARTIQGTKPPMPLNRYECPEAMADLGCNILDVSVRDMFAIAIEDTVHYRSWLDRQVDCIRIDSPSVVTSVKWMHSGADLALGTDDGMLELWDVETKVCKQSLFIDDFRVISSATVSDTSTMLFTGTGSGLVTHLDFRQKNAVVVEVETKLCAARGISVSPDEKHLLVGSGKQRMRLFEVNSMNHSVGFSAHQNVVKALAWHDNSRNFFTGCAGGDRSIKVWSMDPNRNPALQSTQATGADVTSLHWVKNRLFSTSGFGDPANGLMSWKVDFRTFQCANDHALEAHEDRVMESKLSKDRTKLVTFGADETLCLWDISGSVQRVDLPHREQKRPLQDQFTIR